MNSTLTNSDVIKAALREINVINEAQNISSEQGTEGLRKLNQMMAVWAEGTVEVGYFQQTNTTDTIPIPRWLELAVQYNLAIELAPSQSASVSAELYNRADMHLRKAESKIMREKQTNLDMTHMPMGQARHRWNIETDV